MASSARTVEQIVAIELLSRKFALEFSGQTRSVASLYANAPALQEGQDSMERFRLALLREPAEPPFGIQINGPAGLATVERELMVDEAQEVVMCFHLDQRHRLRGFQEIARGGIAAAQVDLKVLFGSILLTGLPAMALCHNHPSGDPT